jgi:nucleoside transporter
MFFLQFAVFGSQTILLAGHMRELGFSGTQISWVYATGALAALISPVVAGFLADHFLPTQRLVGICYLLCAPLLWWAWTERSFSGLWASLFLFQLLHVPTMGLTNVVALCHWPDVRRLGHIRAWGTIGWVAISWCLSLYLRWRGGDGGAHLGDGLCISAGLALVMGAYCLTLPHTPPGGANRHPLALLDGFRLVAASRPFQVLFCVSFVVAAARPFFYNLGFLFFSDPHGVNLSLSSSAAVMSLGQIIEIGAMLGLATTLRVLGTRWTICLGALAQGVRFAVFSMGGPAWLVIAAQSLHGIGFTFFSIGSVLAVETLAPHEKRGSAQGLLVFVNGGLGALAGHALSGWAYDRFGVTTSAGFAPDWGLIYLLPAIGAIGAGLAFALLYRDPHRPSRTGFR